MKREKRKGRLALTLLLMGFVFLLNTIALLLALGLIYLLARWGVIAVSAGQVQLHYGEFFDAKAVPVLHGRPVRQCDAIASDEASI